jgi:hypothetical protein
MDLYGEPAPTYRRGLGAYRNAYGPTCPPPVGAEGGSMVPILLAGVVGIGSLIAILFGLSKK